MKRIEGINLKVCAAYRRDIRLNSGADLREKVADTQRADLDPHKSRRNWRNEIDFDDED
jgi:hypothetical protein